MEATVHALFVAPAKKAKSIPVSMVMAALTGFEGDHHMSATSRRQILMVSLDVLREFELQPGSLCENVVVDGVDVMALVEGQRVRIGEALLEVTSPCEPCGQMDRIRSGLKASLRDRRGMFVKVLSAGVIRVGDPLKLLDGG